MRTLILILTAFFMFCGAAQAPAAPPNNGASERPTATNRPIITPSLTDKQRQQNLESFDVAWKTIRDNHFDAKLSGANWKGVHDELRPQMEKAETMEDARSIMDKMIAKLGHSHVVVIPASFYDESPGSGAMGKAGKASERAVPGVHVRMVKGEATVVKVVEGFPAAKAGVRPGWRIRKIDGEDLTPIFLRIRKAVTAETKVLGYQAMVVESKLSGEQGKTVAVTFVDGADQETTLLLDRAEPIGKRVQVGGSPTEHVHYESKTVDGVVYFRLNAFSDPARVLAAFGKTVQENLKAEGFVLDLRGNPGGFIQMAQGMGGWFVKRANQKLGTMIDRNNKSHLHLNLRQATYEGPLAILVDELSASSSEILSAGLQDLSRARIFGRRTPGSCLPSLFMRLPNGDRLQYVTADYVSTGGQRLEGNGVQPDEVVHLDLQSLLEGRDRDLEAAQEWIQSQQGTGARN